MGQSWQDQTQNRFSFNPKTNSSTPTCDSPQAQREELEEPQVFRESSGELQLHKKGAYMVYKLENP